ncbi:MAG: YXWGXW repeat-containing protein [Verrucomicrobia bacterium]|nr:YXWGXW repeat-containing protein [Verrucomicrobiota bacterium]
MKTSFKILSIASFAAVAVTGCYTEREIIREPAGAVPTSSRTVVRETVVVDQPPVPQVEAVGVAPSGEHVWVPGHWMRQGDRWVWMSGRYDLRPTPTAVYMPGHWDRQGNGFVWREGYWK